jgi:thioredoxin-like negative regulator of GroEL
MSELTAATSSAELQALLAREPAVLLYFSTPDCRVCQALRPKVAGLLAAQFPRLRGVYVDCAALPAAAAGHGVFSVPTLLAFFDAREWVRRGRAVSLDELRAALARPYALRFGGNRADGRE